MLDNQDEAVEAGRLVRSQMPFLRRLGRAIVGDQACADFAVVQLMEDVLSDPTTLSSTPNNKLSLYRRLLSSLDAIALHDPSQAFLDSSSLAECGRRGHLLTAVEGFSSEAAAEILSLTQEQFKAALAEAASEYAMQSGRRVLVIEDEAFIAHGLRQIVGVLGHSVVATAKTKAQAIAACAVDLPDLILSDVQLEDGSSGIDTVYELQARAVVPVIFITAYPERLLRGLHGEPPFIISKPFNRRAVEATINQALHLMSRDDLRQSGEIHEHIDTYCDKVHAGEPAAEPSTASDLIVDRAIFQQFVSSFDHESVAKALDIYINELESKIRMLSEVGTGHDRTALEMLAHSVRGSSSIVGAAALVASCKTIETQCQDADFDWDSLRDLETLIKATLREVQSLVRAGGPQS